MMGSTSTSESFRVALDFAKTNDPKKHSVLFVMAVHNYSPSFPFTGFRMNSELYTAHPDEKEILFMEGLRVAVVGVDEVKFDEDAFTDSVMKDFNGKTLTIIYLFHADWC